MKFFNHKIPLVYGCPQGEQTSPLISLVMNQYIYKQLDTLDLISIKIQSCFFRLHILAIIFEHYFGWVKFNSVWSRDQIS
jgi:hypothetical protein